MLRLEVSKRTSLLLISTSLGFSVYVVWTMGTTGLARPGAKVTVVTGPDCNGVLEAPAGDDIDMPPTVRMTTAIARPAGIDDGRLHLRIRPFLNRRHNRTPPAQGGPLVRNCNTLSVPQMV
jgi:hypothetical protein